MEIKEKVYTLHDLKAEGFTTPLVCTNDESAMRVIGRMMVQDPTSIVALYPQDYRLVCIGSYDGKTGTMEPSDLKIVCNVSVIKNAMEGK